MSAEYISYNRLYRGEPRVRVVYTKVVKSNNLDVPELGRYITRAFAKQDRAT